MVKKYRVYWKDNDTGKTGHGKEKLPEQIAMAWVSYGNKNFSNILHWMK